MLVVDIASDMFLDEFIFGIDVTKNITVVIFKVDNDCIEGGLVDIVDELFELFRVTKDTLRQIDSLDSFLGVGNLDAGIIEEGRREFFWSR